MAMTNTERSRKYREENREKLREYHQAWRDANREKVRESTNNFYSMNKEKLVEAKRVYREVNREKILELRRVYREANKEKIHQYREANKHKYNNGNAIYKMSRALGIPASDIPLELVEAKIATLTVTRKVKELMK